MRIDGKTIAIILAPLVSVFLIAGVFVYIMLVYIGETEPPGFELALIPSILGGLLFSGVGTASLPPQLQSQVKRIGILYLLATIGFILLILFLPAARLNLEGIAYCSVLSVLVFAIFESSFLFGIATFRLIYLTPELWS